jgi:hypothetical protein
MRLRVRDKVASAEKHRKRWIASCRAGKIGPRKSQKLASSAPDVEPGHGFWLSAKCAKQSIEHNPFAAEKVERV